MSTEGPARVSDPAITDDEQQFELTVRPTRLADYIGQRQVKENLRIYMKAALNRKEALDHVLLTGPPGLGKTTLANIIAQEMGAVLHSTGFAYGAAARSFWHRVSFGFLPARGFGSYLQALGANSSGGNRRSRRARNRETFARHAAYCESPPATS